MNRLLEFLIEANRLLFTHLENPFDFLISKLVEFFNF